MTGIFISLLFSQYENVKDHPALSRFKGSEVIHYEVKEFDEYYLLRWYYISASSTCRAIKFKRKHKSLILYEEMMSFWVGVEKGV